MWSKAFFAVGTLTVVTLTLLFINGCSRIENVEIVNHYTRPVKIDLKGVEEVASVPAGSSVILNKKYYVGSGFYAKVYSLSGKKLFDGFINVPGDSAFRSQATVEVGP